MKFKCKTADLRRVVDSLNHIATRAFMKTPIILIESSVKSQGIRLRSSHALMRGRAVIKDGVIVDSKGAYCMVSTSLKDALHGLRNVDDEFVELEINKSGLMEINSGDATYKYGVLPESKLARFNEEKCDYEVELDCEQFKDMLTKVCVVANKDFPARIEIHDNKMHFLGISPVRMCTGSLPVGTDIEDGFSIQFESLLMLQKLANSSTGKVILGWSPNSVMMKFDEYHFFSSRSGKVVPNLDPVFKITDRSPIKVTIPMTELRRKLEPFQAMTKGSSTLTMTFANNEIDMYLDNVDIGSIRRIANCDYSGEEFKIMLNAVLLYDFVKNFSTDNWLIKMTDAKTPVMLQCIEDPDIKYILSPVAF